MLALADAGERMPNAGLNPDKALARRSRYRGVGFLALR
jgi:hypothetical protein